MVSSKDLDNVTHSELVQKFGEKILMKYNKTTIVWKKLKNGLTNVFFVCDPYSVIEHFNSDYENIVFCIVLPVYVFQVQLKLLLYVFLTFALMFY